MASSVLRTLAPGRAWSVSGSSGVAVKSSAAPVAGWRNRAARTRAPGRAETYLFIDVRSFIGVLGALWARPGCASAGLSVGLTAGDDKRVINGEGIPIVSGPAPDVKREGRGSRGESRMGKHFLPSG